MAIPRSSSGEMPFLDHLEELRWRIIYSLIAVMIGLAIGLIISFKFDLLQFLQGPVRPYMNGHKLTVLHPMDPFTIRIQLAFVVGLTLAAPVIGYQIWLFLSPALHKREKQVVIPILIAGFFLFLAGMALSWFFVLPASLKYIYGLVGQDLEPMYSVAEYFGFITNMELAFGVAFELPLLLVALVGLGILRASTLNKSRKWAVLIIWTAAAIISPGDQVIATIGLAVPLYFLYEISIVVSYFIEFRRRRYKIQE